jgi:D-tyrosyl-tRNA(Tyr) deacylase
MRVVLQRVTTAAVAVDGHEIGRIGPGLLALVGIGAGDDHAVVERMAAKVAALRIFRDDRGHMNRDVRDHKGAVLSVSQFTLYADVRRGRRPGFTEAAAPEVAKPLWLAFGEALRVQGLPVHEGEFGADMAVSLVNDGPVTILLDSAMWGGGDAGAV